MDELIKTFVDRLKLPASKPARPFILGIIGNIGSGKTTVARKLVPLLDGTIHVQANSARYMLKEAGMEWGGNVRALLEGVVRLVAGYGYAVILDGSTAEAADRERLERAAAELKVPVLYVRVRCETEICRLRTQRKYDDASWQSTFEDFRVNTTEKMVANAVERAQVHHNLDSQTITHLVAEIDANVAPEELDRQIPGVVAKIKVALGL